MKAVILAGGYGSRLSEETQVRPKPMVEVGGRPILWHILKIYTAHGITDFVICGGYKASMIKEYFANYYLYHSDCHFDLRNNRMEIVRNGVEPWSVTLIDTGENTMTGGRLKRVREHLDDETFFVTYGDGVSNVNIRCLLEFHPGKARRRRCMGQRRLLRRRARRARLRRRRQHGVGEGTARAARGRRAARRLQASRLLAADGHAARQDVPGRALAIRRRSMEGVVTPAMSNGIR
jgi:hypothetical protein